MEKKFLIGLVVLLPCIAASGQQQRWPQANHLIPDGPFAHELVTDNFEMSRDFAFDGMGNVMGAQRCRYDSGQWGLDPCWEASH